MNFRILFCVCNTLALRRILPEYFYIAVNYFNTINLLVVTRSSFQQNLFKASVIYTIEFFTVCTKLAEMALLYSKELTTAKKKLPPVGLGLMQEIITGLGVQCLTIWAKLPCAI